MVPADGGAMRLGKHRGAPLGACFFALIDYLRQRPSKPLYNAEIGGAIFLLHW